MSYDPTLGRFMQEDPSRYIDGGNMYQLEISNPVGMLDPSGTAAWTIDPNSKLDESTLQHLREVMREYVEQYMRKPDKDMDCADLALTSLAKAAKELKLPLRLPVWNAKTGQWDYLDSRSDKYNNSDDYIKDITQQLGAISLYDRNKITKPADLSKLQPGDVIVYDLRNHRSGYTGHTMIVCHNDPDGNRVLVGEAHMEEHPDEKWYDYKDIQHIPWNNGPAGGPVGNKGRTWNWGTIIPIN